MLLAAGEDIVADRHAFISHPKWIQSQILNMQPAALAGFEDCHGRFPANFQPS
jgi:hypothetical protein